MTSNDDTFWSCLCCARMYRKDGSENDMFDADHALEALATHRPKPDPPRPGEAYS